MSSGRRRDLAPLDELPGLLGDQGVVLRLQAPPPLHTRRLMATLGVRIEVTTTVSAQDFTATHDCVTPGCPDAAEAGMTHCRRHADVSELRARRENGEGLAALERMDAGEPQAPHAEPQARPEGWSRKRKTRGEIIAGLRRFHEEEGRPPTQADRRSYLASVNATKREFGSWEAAFEAMGWEPAAAGGRNAAARARAADGADPANQPRKPESATAETRAAVLTWIRGFHGEHGFAPSARDLGTDPERPCSMSRAKQIFGNWGNAVVEAGFDRTKTGNGGRHRRNAPQNTEAQSRPREPEPADEDVGCNAFPDPPRPFIDLVTEWEEARAAAAAAETTWENLNEKAARAAEAVTNHPDYHALEELAALTR